MTRLPGQRGQPTAEVDSQPGRRARQHRQERVQHAHCANHVRFDVSRIRSAVTSAGADHGVAGAPFLPPACDQDVQPPSASIGLRGGQHGRVVGDVQLDGPRPSWAAARRPRSASRLPRYTVWPASRSWRRSRSRDPCSLPVISVVSCLHGAPRPRVSTRRPVFLGLRVPGSHPAGVHPGGMTAEFGKALRPLARAGSPETAGLPRRRHRRAPGLRARMLAWLAGISVSTTSPASTGPGTNPSAQVIEALARALRLAGEERAHLFRLGGMVAPGPTWCPRTSHRSVQRLLDRLVGAASASTTRLDAAAGQPLYAALMGDPTGWRGQRAQRLWRNFVGGANGRGRPRSNGAQFEVALVADLRETAGRYPGRPTPARLSRPAREQCAVPASCGTPARSAGTKRPARPSTTDGGPLTLGLRPACRVDHDCAVMLYTAPSRSQSSVSGPPSVVDGLAGRFVPADRAGVPQLAEPRTVARRSRPAGAGVGRPE